jgi:uncharacterized protein with FMN-binding domain
VILLSLALSVLASPLWATEEDFKNGIYEGKLLFLKDGTYQGIYFFITVAVKMEGGEISDIKFLHHGNGGKKYEVMVEPLIGEMIRKQSTEVDTVTGATISTRNLRQAVIDALLQSAGARK